MARSSRLCVQRPQLPPSRPVCPRQPLLWEGTRERRRAPRSWAAPARGEEQRLHDREHTRRRTGRHLPHGAPALHGQRGHRHRRDRGRRQRGVRLSRHPLDRDRGDHRPQQPRPRHPRGVVHQREGSPRTRRRGELRGRARHHDLQAGGHERGVRPVHEPGLRGLPRRPGGRGGRRPRSHLEPDRAGLAPVRAVRPRSGARPGHPRGGLRHDARGL